VAESFKELKAECDREQDTHPGFTARWDGYHRKWLLRFPVAKDLPRFRQSATNRFRNLARRVAHKFGIEGDSESLTFWLELVANWDGLGFCAYPRDGSGDGRDVYASDDDRQAMAETGLSLSDVRAARGGSNMPCEAFKEAIEPLPIAVEDNEIRDLFHVSAEALDKLHSLEATGNLPDLAASAAERDQELLTALKGIKRGIQAPYIDREPLRTEAHVKLSAELRVRAIREDLTQRQSQGEVIPATDLDAWEEVIHFTRAQADDKPAIREPNTIQRQLRLIADAWGFYCGALARNGMLTTALLYDYGIFSDLLIKWKLCPFETESALPAQTPHKWFMFGRNYFRKGNILIASRWLARHGSHEFKNGDTRNVKVRAYAVIANIVDPVSRRWEEKARQKGDQGMRTCSRRTNCWYCSEDISSQSPINEDG
jgi:hypothetical protein